MAPKFGTSGLRELIAEPSEPLVQDYARSIPGSLATAAHVGHDLRASSQKIVGFVATAATTAGHDVIDIGLCPPRRCGDEK